MTANYIGLACTMHDGALAIVDANGQIAFAEATERFLQYKRSWDCPPDSCMRLPHLLERYCDRNADLVVAKTWSDAYEKAGGVAQWTSGTRSEPALGRWLRAGERNRAAVSVAGRGLRGAADELGTRVTVKGYDHHLCHAAAACFTSPFTEAVCAIVDGFGERDSTNFYRYQGGHFTSLKQRPDTASLGIFYGYLCQLCGFDPAAGDQWKVMGLAPYGRLDDEIYAVLNRHFRVDGLSLQGASAMRGELSPYARQRGTPALTVADLAHTGQRFFCDKMCEILTNLYQFGLSENLVLGGGCVLNSSCNGEVLDRVPFSALHAWCAPGDDGNAVGAALLAFRDHNPGALPPAQTHTPYLGSSMSPETLANLKRFGGIRSMRELSGKDIVQRTAELLAAGKLIGWIQGRAEFGPRALGNRSILADPRRAEVKDELNARVKFREEFRPFAPAILHEYGPEFFEHYQESPYMERALRWRPEIVARVPGVVHEDRTGRLQTVRRERNERYYDLIHEFHRLTGVPVLLNTSYNVMGKPIAHSVEDVIAVFFTSGLDALVIDDYLIEK